MDPDRNRTKTTNFQSGPSPPPSAPPAQICLGALGSARSRCQHDLDGCLTPQPNSQLHFMPKSNNKYVSPGSGPESAQNQRSPRTKMTVQSLPRTPRGGNTGEGWGGVGGGARTKQKTYLNTAGARHRITSKSTLERRHETL